MKKIIENIWDKFFIKQWSVGLAYGTPEQVLGSGLKDLHFKWIPIADNSRFLADPFIVRKINGEILLYVEDFHYKEQYGKISVFRLNDKFEVIENNVILDTGSHLSYPLLCHHDGKYFLIPESGMSNELRAHELDPDGMHIVDEMLIHQGDPLLDATLLYYDQKHWLFATKRGNCSNSDLYVYHGNSWNHGYKLIHSDPVKIDAEGSRPAGHFFSCNGSWYRPAQNSRDYYGKSIIINKLEMLSEVDYQETKVMELHPVQNAKYNHAIHTINFSNGVIVIDGLRKIFHPWKQLMAMIQKRRKMRQ